MRINIIPVNLLTDAHLRAEFREIIMSIHYYKRSKLTKQGIIYTDIPEAYLLNKGHAYFFYNKFQFVFNRFYELLNEMYIRGFKTGDNEAKFTSLFKEHIEELSLHDYSVTEDDVLINIERILDKLYYMEFVKGKPNFYKLNKNTKTFMEWCIFYTEKLELKYQDVHSMIQDIEQKYK